MKQDWGKNSPFLWAVQCLAHRQLFNFLNIPSPSSSELLCLYLPNINAVKFLCDGEQPFDYQDDTKEFMPWCVYILLTTCFRNYLVQGRRDIWISWKTVCVFKRLRGHLPQFCLTEMGAEGDIYSLLSSIISPLRLSLFLCSSLMTVFLCVPICLHMSHHGCFKWWPLPAHLYHRSAHTSPHQR